MLWCLVQVLGQVGLDLGPLFLVILLFIIICGNPSLHDPRKTPELTLEEQKVPVREEPSAPGHEDCWAQGKSLPPPKLVGHLRSGEHGLQAGREC